MLTDFSDIFSLEGVSVLADEIVPVLEKNLYGCHLFVDKVYCYRNHYFTERSASWLWHWDNNPDEVVKIIVYLTDVDDDCGPFEYVVGANGKPLLKKSTRSGYNNWKKPPNGSRIPEKDVEHEIRRGGKTVRVTGKAGTVVAFNNNVWHRANIPAEGKHRDIITFRVRPTAKPVSKYVHPKWTTTSDVSGAVPKDPEQLRQV